MTQPLTVNSLYQDRFSLSCQASRETRIIPEAGGRVHGVFLDGLDTRGTPAFQVPSPAVVAATESVRQHGSIAVREKQARQVNAVPGAYSAGDGLFTGARLLRRYRREQGTPDPGPVTMRCLPVDSD